MQQLVPAQLSSLLAVVQTPNGLLQSEFVAHDL
jgi:hypothetical protein